MKPLSPAEECQELCLKTQLKLQGNHKCIGPYIENYFVSYYFWGQGWTFRFNITSSVTVLHYSSPAHFCLTRHTGTIQQFSIHVFPSLRISRTHLIKATAFTCSWLHTASIYTPALQTLFARLFLITCARHSRTLFQTDWWLPTLAASSYSW